MAKRKKKEVVEEVAVIEEVNPAPEQMVDITELDWNPALTEEEIADKEAMEEQQAEAEVEADNAKPNSVVLPKFKDKYLANARALGIPGKAAKRSNWDWLSQQIAAQCLTDKHKLKVDEFLALMDANGVDHSRWTNRNKGWEGRLRMTGRVALQKKVGNSGGLVMLDGTVSAAPDDFVAKFKDKE